MQILLGVTNVPQILVTWTVYVTAGIFFIVAGLWFNRGTFPVWRFLSENFPLNIIKSQSVRLDLKVYVIGKLTDTFWAAPGALLSAVLPLAVSSMLGRVAPASQNDANAATLTVIGISLFLTIELAEYLMHYSEHRIPVLWELHKVHHSADSLNPLTAKRGHPISLVIVGAVRAIFVCVPAGAAMHFVGLSLVEVLATQVIVSKTCTVFTLDTLRHSSFPVGFGWFDRLFISPHMHQIHHSSLEPHWDKNFGTNLSLFDWLFDTAYKPIRGEKIELGLYGYSSTELARFHTLFGTYIAPVASAWKKTSSSPSDTLGRGPFRPTPEDFRALN